MPQENRFVTVNFTPEQSERIAKLAAERNAGDYDRGQTRNLNPHRDEIGLAGEAGVHLWLQGISARFKPLWKDNRPGPDFDIEGAGLADVKRPTGSGRTVLWNSAQYLKWKSRTWREDILLFAKIRADTMAEPRNRFKTATLLGWTEADGFIAHPESRVVGEGSVLGSGGRCAWTCIELPTSALKAMDRLAEMIRGAIRSQDAREPVPRQGSPYGTQTPGRA